MTWSDVLKIVLLLAAYLARRAERRDIEAAVRGQVERIHAKHVDEAAAARDRVTTGSLPSDRNPNQRD